MRRRRVILATKSTARKKVFALLGIRFLVDEPQVPEYGTLRRGPRHLVVSNALRKVRDVASRHTSGIVIAADTAVPFGRRLIGKPTDLADAVRTLRSFSRRPQWVYTGVAVIDIDRKKTLTACERTRVFMRPMSEAEIRGYFRKAPPFGKAGSFDIQGLGGAFVRRIDGCFYNVVGLPLSRLTEMLKRVGVRVF